MDNLRFALSNRISCLPRLYMPLERLRRRRVQNLVSKETQITIEGFPRSGTSFAVRAFQQANPDARIAHHKHAAAQIIASVGFGLPTLLVIREPEDALRSLLVRRAELTPEVALKAWVRFHHAVAEHRDQIVVGTFQQITTDFGAVTRLVNERFGSRFECFRHDAEHVEVVFREMDEANVRAYGGLRQTHVPRPESGRERQKAEIDLGGLKSGLRQARRIYDALLGRQPLQ